MAVWTVMDIDVAGEADGEKTVRLRLSDEASVVDRVMALAEARALRRQIEDVSKANPDAASTQARLGGEFFEIDLGSARSFLDKLPQDRPSTSGKRGRGVFPIVAVVVMLALLAGWGATYLMLRSSIDDANAAMMKFAGRLIQAPRGSQPLVDQAVEMLAKDADIPLSPERRRQLVQVLAKYPDTSLDTIIELYGAEFPEFTRLAERLGTYGLGRAGEAASPGDPSPGASIAGAQKPESGSAQSQPSGKEADRLPEEEDESSAGRMKESSKAVKPAPTEMDKGPSPGQ
ncbi:MAG: hypothetical protein AB7F74_01015 [Parvibaculaceae bacterium]